LKRIIEHYNIKSVERKYYSSNSALIQIWLRISDWK
jgi:hypothetical protein